MEFNFQPTLEDELVVAKPIQQSDFNALYAAANDPLIWEQHPNKNRYTLEGFTNYFEGAVKSEKAFLVRDAKTGEVIGSSRYSVINNEVSIGYTFFKRSHWQKGHNRSLKKLMVSHALQFVPAVYFYIGAVNKRSQDAIEKIGAKKIREEETAYYGEAPKLDYVYEIKKEDWEKRNQDK